MKDKLKKWLFPLMAAIAIMLPTSAFASTNYPDVVDISELTKDDYFTVTNGIGDKLIVKWDGAGYWYTQPYQGDDQSTMKLYSSGIDGWKLYVDLGGGTYRKYNSNSGNMSGGTLKSIDSSTVDIYKDSSKSGVFFSVVHPAVSGVTLEEMAAGVKSQAGLIVSSVALATLIIMLGVSLVPRLIRYLAR